MSPVGDWASRLWQQMFGRRKGRAPETLIAQVKALDRQSEQKMLRLAEEAVRRGHPDQAIIAYEKVAARFRRMGQQVKEMAVLQHLVRLQPGVAEPVRKLIDVYEDLGRTQEAASARMRLAAILRRDGQPEAADRLEQEAHAQAFSRSDSHAEAIADAFDDGPAEMPGEQVALGTVSTASSPPLNLHEDLSVPAAALPLAAAQAMPIASRQTSSGPVGRTTSLNGRPAPLAPSVRAESAMRAHLVHDTVAVEAPVLNPLVFEDTGELEAFIDISESAVLSARDQSTVGVDVPRSEDSFDVEDTAAVSTDPVRPPLKFKPRATESDRGLDATRSMPAAPSSDFEADDDEFQKTQAERSLLEEETVALPSDSLEADAIDTDAAPIPAPKSKSLSAPPVKNTRTSGRHRRPSAASRPPEATVMTDLPAALLEDAALWIENDDPEPQARTRTYDPEEMARLQKLLKDTPQ